jgi:DNA-directed RNA polymerase specialized sigma24 family protein
VLGSLPERYHQILELRFLQAMPLKEAAREMDALPQVQVRSRDGQVEALLPRVV